MTVETVIGLLKGACDGGFWMDSSRKICEAFVLCDKVIPLVTLLIDEKRQGT